MFPSLVCLDGHRSVPEKYQTNGQDNRENAINSIYGIFKNSSENQDIDFEYPYEELCELRIEEDVNTQEEIECHEDNQESFDSLPYTHWFYSHFYCFFSYVWYVVFVISCKIQNPPKESYLFYWWSIGWERSFIFEGRHEE